MAWKVRDADDWHEVTQPQVRVGDQWAPVVRALVRVGGQWVRFYPDSEVTVTRITSGLTGIVSAGVARQVGGTVTAVAGSVVGGTVTVFQRALAGSWTAVGSAAVGSGAVAPWSATVTPVICGDTEFRAVYSGTAVLAGSESDVSAVTVTMVTPAQPTGGTITNTTAALSWAAVPLAATYSVFRDGMLVGSPVAPSFADVGLAPGSTHSWTVRANGTSGCVSALSPARVGRTGTDATRDTGSATISVRPDKTNSYRPDTGWGYIGEHVGQGYYSDSARNYTGTIDFGGLAALRAKVEAALGANGATRFDNMTVAAARVYLFKRTGVGSSGSVTVSFFNSPATAGAGGAPARNGTGVSAASAASGAGSYLSIGVAHWAALKDGSARSIVLYNVTTANYSQFDGKSVAANRCDLQLDCSWDYALTVATPPAWI